MDSTAKTRIDGPGFCIFTYELLKLKFIKLTEGIFYDF